MTSTPSVPQYMPSICQNIDVSRHVLVYRYIHDRANRMVENTTIRSYRCVCDSQMQRPGVIILLFEKKQTRVWEDECVHAPLLFLYNILLNSEYKFLWVARWCVREVPRDRSNASEKRLAWSSPRGYCFSQKIMFINALIAMHACMHKVHALVNFLLILACNDLMHLRIWTCDGEQPNWDL